MDNLFTNAMQTFKSLITKRFEQVYGNEKAIILLDNTSGDRVNITKNPKPLNVQLTDIDSLIQFLKNFDNHGLDHAPPSIFVQPNAITVALDFEEYNLARVKVPIHINPLFGYLTSQPIKGEPAAVVKSLRYNLKSALTTSPDPTQSLAVLKFNSSSETETTAKVNDEGMSKTLKAKVSGATEIPDDFTVYLHMYPAIAKQVQDGSEVSLNMDIHVDPSAGIITIRPFPGEADKAMNLAMGMVQDTLIYKLGESAKPELAQRVYLGSPD